MFKSGGNLGFHLSLPTVFGLSSLLRRYAAPHMKMAAIVRATNTMRNMRRYSLCRRGRPSIRHTMPLWRAINNHGIKFKRRISFKK